MKVFKAILIAFFIILMMFVLVGCSENDERNNDVSNTEILLQPIFLPSSSGTIKMVMIPRLIKD